MKQVTLVFMILLLATAYSYTSSNPAEEAEHWEKVRQMDQLAERFKAETGFRGEVSYNFMRMKFGTFRGKFADIPFSADADTTAFRQACNSILDKILPYSLATRSQLSMNRISRQDGYTRTKYYQLVNGYGVEGLGFIMITYDAGRYRYSIGDNTVELPNEPIGDIMSESEAYQIAFRQYQQTELYNAKYPVTSRTVIQYKSRKVDGQAQPYRLCWRVSFPSISYYIDVITKNSYSEGYVINQ